MDIYGYLDIANFGTRFIFSTLVYNGMKQLIDMSEIVLACPRCYNEISEEDIIDNWAISCPSCGKVSHVDYAKVLE